jgi:flagellar biosynthesis protein FliR
MTLAPLLPSLVDGLPGVLRAAGAAALVPAFTGMPTWVRAALVVVSAAVAWPMSAGAQAPEGSPWIWGPRELGMGLLIGGVAAASTGALRWGGRIIGEQMGLGVGDAGLAEGGDAGANPVEEALGWCSAACFVAVGGIESTVIAAVGSGGLASADAARAMASTLDAAMQVALRVSVPVLALTLAGAAVGGAVARASPGLVTLAGGFGVRAAMGLGMLAATAAGLWVAQASLVRDALGRLGGGAS